MARPPSPSYPPSVSLTPTTPPPSILSSFNPSSLSLPLLYPLPQVIPLAVRSPYLGTYLQDGPDKDLTEMSPRFWTGTPIGWNGLIRVDGHVFNWMGNYSHWPAANNTRFEFTPSSSKFTFAIGPPPSPEDQDQSVPQPPKLYLTANFLSPITPNDPFRQSLPFSYLSLTVESADQEPHQVQLYTDINGLWCADDESLPVEWSTHHSKDSEQNLTPRSSWQAMEIRLVDQQPFVERDDRILHGGVWFSSMSFDEDRIQTTYTAGQDANLTRTQFSQLGRLDLPINQTFRPIRTRSTPPPPHHHPNADRRRHESDEESIIDEPILAWAHSFGRISPQRSLNSRSILLTIGHVRSPLVRYMTADENVVELEPLWTSRFKNVTEMIEFHLLDYYHILAATQSWDSQLYADADRVHSRAYAHILAVSTRQIFMAIEATRADYDGTETLTSTDSILVDGTSTMMMLKEVSSNGNCQTVDVITPMLPFLIYAIPRMIPQLLEPIFRYIATGLYQPKPTPHDLGDHYPNATGRNDYIYANLPLEESGNLLAMVLACLRLDSCQDQAQTYYHILVQWADWLIENTLYPDDQRSTDDFFGPTPNQTSLVVKGIMGLRSMSEISSSLGQANDSTRYHSKAIEFSKKLLKLGVSEDRTHMLGFYGNQSSWSTQYNLFFDRLFNFNLFPNWVYEMQDQWYLAKAVPGGFGPPLDSRSENRAKTDWLMWAAGASRSNVTRGMFVDGLYKYVRQTDNMVFGDLISLDGGWSVGFLTRPVVGGHFSLLGLDTMSSKPSFTSHRKLFGSLDVDALIDRLGRQKEKVLGYGRTPNGQKFISCLGLVFLFFFGYRILSRWLNRRRSRKSKELYRSVIENYGDDDDDGDGNGDDREVGYLHRVRRRSKSLLRSLGSTGHQTKHGITSQEEEEDRDRSRSLKLFELGGSRRTRRRSDDRDDQQELSIGLLSRARGRGEGDEEGEPRRSSRVVIPLKDDTPFRLTDESDDDDDRDGVRDDQDDDDTDPSRHRSRSLQSQADWDLGLVPASS